MVQSRTEQASTVSSQETFVSAETLDAACQRISRLEDLARNVAALDESALTSADLNFYRATIREWRKQARELMQ